MSGITSIEWTDRSSNPLRFYDTRSGKRGWFCVHASAGCANCYSEVLNLWVGNKLPYRAQEQGHVRVELDAEELRSWARLPAGTKVFPFDMTDLFMNLVPDAMLDAVMTAMATSLATFQILTKRAGRMASYVDDWHRRAQHPTLPNVWWGVSAEDQANADRRIPELLRLRHAAKRWVSYEPALGPVDFARWLWRGCSSDCGGCGAYWPRNAPPPCSCARPWHVPGLDWIVVGGESGHHARPFDLPWARSAIRQGREAGVPIFVKQLGAKPVDSEHEAGVWAPHDRRAIAARAALGLAEGCEPNLLLLKDRKGKDMAEWPGDLCVREMPEAA